MRTGIYRKGKRSTRAILNENLEREVQKGIKAEHETERRMKYEASEDR